MTFKSILIFAFLFCCSLTMAKTDPCATVTRIEPHKRVPRKRSRTSKARCPAGTIMVQHSCTHTNPSRFLTPRISVQKDADGNPIGIDCTVKRNKKGTRRSTTATAKIVCVETPSFLEGFKPTTNCRKTIVQESHDDIKAFTNIRTDAVCPDGGQRFRFSCDRTSSKFSLATLRSTVNGNSAVSCVGSHSRKVDGISARLDVTYTAELECL